MATDRALQGSVMVDRMAAVGALVSEHGWNTTSSQVLDGGMRHWFSASGDAVVGYVEAAGYRVVAGVPVAAEGRLGAVAAEFEDAARSAGRRVCYFSAEERFLAATRTRNYATYLVGTQPTWSAPAWADRFDSDPALRAQRNRAANKGVSVREAPPMLENEDELRSCHAAWLSTKGLPALGFLAHSATTGAGGRDTRTRRLFVARRARHREDVASDVVGYLTACPVPSRRGWLIDKVVRHPAAPNGTTELLVDAALRRLAPDADRFTLGMAPLAAAVEGSRARAQRNGVATTTPGWLAVLERLAVRHARRLYDFEGLYRFKAKFRPDAWEPLYLLTNESALTFRALFAVLVAFLAPVRSGGLAGVDALGDLLDHLPRERLQVRGTAAGD